VVVSADATRFASAGADGTVTIWSTAENKPRATLVQLTPGSDDWLIVAADGWYAACKPEAVNWQAANVAVAPDRLAALQNPEAVQQTLAGEPPAARLLP
jgi:hypothetical protein